MRRGCVCILNFSALRFARAFTLVRTESMIYMCRYGPGGPTWGWNHTEGNSTLAAFLITRPPYGWIGYSIEDARACGHGNTASCWNPLFNMHVGEPTGDCQEKDSVFSRKWSKGTAVLDCNTFTSVLPFELT